jgi:hypothetical protein
MPPAPVSKYGSSPYHKPESPYHVDKADIPYPYSQLYAKSRVPPMIFDIDGFGNVENRRGDYGEERHGYYYHPDHLSTAPADSVSLALAYELAKRAGTAVTEDDLNFGPRTLPLNGAVTKSRKYVPEERLFNFDKQVVELRYPTARCGLSAQNEALLAAQEEGHPCRGSANYLTYADLGYIPDYL